MMTNLFKHLYMLIGKYPGAIFGQGIGIIIGISSGSKLGPPFWLGQLIAFCLIWTLMHFVHKYTN